MLTVTFESLDYSQFDRKQVRSAMGKGARAVTKELKALVNRAGSGGRTYVRGGRKFTASLPGHAPGRFSGNLFRSMAGRASKRGYALVVQAKAPHAHMMQLGTRNMAPRPAFEAAFAAQAGTVQELLRAAIGDGLHVIAGKPGSPPQSVEVG